MDLSIALFVKEGKHMHLFKSLSSISAGVILYTFVLSNASAETFCTHSSSKCLEIESTLQGKWQMVKWRTDNASSEYKPVLPPITITKIYRANEFYQFVSTTHGQINETIVGTYTIIDEHSIEETITLFSPFHEKKPFRGANNQVTISSGESMVGSHTKLSIEIEGELMTHKGLITQVIPQGENADMYSPRYVDVVFKKVSNKKIGDENHTTNANTGDTNASH